MTLNKDKVELDEILIPIMFGADGILKPDGSSLIAQIVYGQKSQLNKAKQAIIDWHSKQVAKAEKRAFLDGQKFGIETTMKLHNIPKRIIEVKELESKINE